MSKSANVESTGCLDRIITVQKQRIFTRLIPSPTHLSSPTLVFLHDGLGSVAQWRDFPKKLLRSTGLPGLLYDRPGHGFSAPRITPPRKDYLHSEARDILPAVMAAHNIHSVILFGHSDGASIALLAATDFPGQVHKTILLSPHIFVEPITRRGVATLISSYQTGPMRNKLQPFHGEKTDSLFHAWSDLWVSDEFSDWNISSYLPDLSCPTLLIQGEADPYGTSAQVEQIAAYMTGENRLVLIPSVGHFPHREAPERVLAESTDFINHKREE